MTESFRLRLPRWCLIATLCLMASPVALAGPHHPQISVRPAPDPAAPPTVVISGLWPDTCVPQLEESTFDRGWTLRAKAPRGPNCRAETTHYSETVDLAALEVRPGASYGAEATPVRFFVRIGNDSVYRLLAFTLARWGQDELAPKPESGIWWPRAGVEAGTGPGIGMTIEIQASEVVVIVNAYAVTGDPEWYIGSGRLQGRIFSARLYRLAGGQTLLSDYAPPNEAFDHAQIHIEFNAIASATAWLSRTVGAGIDSQLLLRPIGLTRYRFGVEPGTRGMAGSWLLAVDGESIALELVPRQDSLRDDDAGFELSCTETQGEDLPAACEIRQSGTAIGVITEFGLDSMEGKRFNGRPIHMTRLR